MLADQVRAALAANQLAVIIGARGTGKSRCAEELSAAWSEAGVGLVRVDASDARHPEDLNDPLAEVLRCHPSRLGVDALGENDVVRVIVDNCDRLFDRPWVAEWQEQWRAVLSSPRGHGKLAAVLFGRPLFRQIAGGDASPLLNAGRVIAVSPLSPGDIQQQFDLDSSLAEAIRKKTGGHPKLTAALARVINGNGRSIRRAVKKFVAEERSYLVRLAQDHSLGGQAILGELLRGRSAVHESALIRRHFDTAHADGREAVDDLCGCGLIKRTESGDCSISADLLRNVDGLQEAISAPVMTRPSYNASVMDACWRCLFLSENRLREIVAESLAAADSAWWILHVPAEVRAAAEGRKKKEAVIAAADDDQSHPLMYLTVGELFELIFANWKRIFGAVFSPVSQSAVEGAAQRFEAIRNRLAHSRPVTENQLRELEMLARRLGLS